MGCGEASHRPCGSRSTLPPHWSNIIAFWTVPPFTSANTFFASREGSRSSIFLRKIPTNFKTFFDYAGKPDLSKRYRNLKNNIGDSIAFFLVELLFGKNVYA